jgi:diguanylate cyclase (GGDEF)-like protein
MTEEVQAHDPKGLNGSDATTTKPEAANRKQVLGVFQHDLRAPLNIVVGYAEMLEEEANDRELDSMAEDLQRIQTAARELSTELDNFFAWLGHAIDDHELAALASTPIANRGPRRPVSEEIATTIGAPQGDEYGHILVVDDDLVTRQMLCERLAQRGYSFSQAADGAEANEICDKEKIDLVLLDVIMPIMGGFEALEMVRKRFSRAELPVVMITGAGRSSEVIQALRLGANDYINKPLDFPILLARMRALLEAKRARDELQRMSITDPLTGVANRRRVLAAGQGEVDRCRRYNMPVSVMMLDIDHFKAVNDTYGHDVGDMVLKASVQFAQGVLRKSDLLGRLGGEEFCVILTNTSLSQALTAAEKVRHAFEEAVVDTGMKTVKFTASFGVAEVRLGQETFEQALKRADEALYVAKKTGRNRVVQAA